MPSLSSMKALDPAGDESLPLGPPIRQPQGVAIPARKPTETPGVFEQADGKLITDLPEPKAPAFAETGDYTRKAMMETYKAMYSGAAVSPAPRSLLEHKPAGYTDELFAALERCVCPPEYKTDGTMWTSHDPAGDVAPLPSAEWVILRCGEIRPAGGVYTWRQGAVHSDYEVVGYK